MRRFSLWRGPLSISSIGRSVRDCALVRCSGGFRYWESSVNGGSTVVAARFDVLMGVVALFCASVAAGDVLVACPALRFVHFLLRHAFFFNPGPPKHLMSTHSGHFPQFGW